MDQYNRLAGAARSDGVVIEAGAVEVEEFAAHFNKKGNGKREIRNGHRRYSSAPISHFSARFVGIRSLPQLLH